MSKCDDANSYISTRDLEVCGLEKSGQLIFLYSAVVYAESMTYFLLNRDDIRMTLIKMIHHLFITLTHLYNIRQHLPL